MDIMSKQANSETGSALRWVSCPHLPVQNLFSFGVLILQYPSLQPPEMDTPDNVVPFVL